MRRACRHLPCAQHAPEQRSEGSRDFGEARLDAGSNLRPRVAASDERRRGAWCHERADLDLARPKPNPTGEVAARPAHGEGAECRSQHDVVAEEQVDRARAATRVDTPVGEFAPGWALDADTGLRSTEHFDEPAPLQVPEHQIGRVVVPE